MPLTVFRRELPGLPGEKIPPESRASPSVDADVRSHFPAAKPEASGGFWMLSSCHLLSLHRASFVPAEK